MPDELGDETARRAVVERVGVVPLQQTAFAHDADPVADLLLRRGQLYVTSSHVDLVLPLAGVSLLVRRAGLDFDPGWLPAWGRVVRFHYE